MFRRGEEEIRYNCMTRFLHCKHSPTRILVPTYCDYMLKFISSRLTPFSGYARLTFKWKSSPRVWTTVGKNPSEELEREIQWVFLLIAQHIDCKEQHIVCEMVMIRILMMCDSYVMRRCNNVCRQW